MNSPSRKTICIVVVAVVFVLVSSGRNLIGASNTKESSIDDSSNRTFFFTETEQQTKVKAEKDKTGFPVSQKYVHKIVRYHELDGIAKVVASTKEKPLGETEEWRDSIIVYLKSGQEVTVDGDEAKALRGWLASHSVK
jgi:hypothetical protein